MKEVYTKAMIDLLNSGSELEEVLARVKTLMTKKGHQRLYKEVLVTVISVLEEQAQKEEVLVVVAKEADKDSALVKNTLDAKFVGVKSRIKVDETLVGGATFLYKNQFSDLSYKASLAKLYKAVTA